MAATVQAFVVHTAAHVAIETVYSVSHAEVR
jgi:hypothetical protein